VIRDLQQDLLRARMVPFASLAERLQRTTRQAARECGRELHFHLEGGQHEVDRSILERLAAPIEHLLRNAAVHGVEDADSRRQLGKPAHGQLTIQLTQGEHEVSLRISDDGRGVDLGRVRARAEANGLLLPGQACPDEELLQLIFRPGFSTASSVTSLAGRGVGLDVVRSEVLGLGGRIHLDTRPGAGTDFTLVIPVTLATVQAVVVRAGDAWFAIPAPLVEQVRPVARDALIQLYRERVAVWQGLRYPFTSLNRVLGLSLGEPEPQGSQQLVFLRSADRRCALRVDELAGTQEIVVKAVSPHLARIPGVTGASVLGNGRIVLILNPVPLAVGADGMIPAALLPAEPVPQAPTVMVVDDSITVRRVTSRLLERAGFQVQLAKDGEDALEQLQDTGHALPGAVLLDVEMPRMDGFELIARLRSDARTAGLPVVVITSRTAERHRNHADSLGVQGYLGKPYREEDLLALLADLVPAPGEPKTATPGGRPVLTVVP
jgi:chemosensory pili system protein ChpA (sensor histidine kinase/response regulator)